MNFRKILPLIKTDKIKIYYWNYKYKKINKTWYKWEFKLIEKMKKYKNWNPK